MKTLLEIMREQTGKGETSQIIAALAAHNPIFDERPAPERVTSYRERARRWIGDRLRRLAERIDP